MTVRKHGRAPFRIAVVHGGPGAGGEMAPVARELAGAGGVLEPIQTAASLAGQVEELARTLEEHCELPATLVGYSWGAWLSCLVAAEHPACVGRLVLVGSGPIEESYAASIRETRASRLSTKEREEFERALAWIEDPGAKDRDACLARLGELASKADAFDPLPWDTRASDAVSCDGAVFLGVWREAAELRRSGELLDRVKGILCPVVAIHGDHDPHPAAGVSLPLSAVLANFRFILLPRCGHTPWLERHARGAFFAALEGALAS
ncbi:MAG: alpha/beta hydrolase [Planctomycetes bacterium]|nr:alpha/beta hydrolase [Planctomycetota bacterium]